MYCEVSGLYVLLLSRFAVREDLPTFTASAELCSQLYLYGILDSWLRVYLRCFELVFCRLSTGACFEKLSWYMFDNDCVNSLVTSSFIYRNAYYFKSPST
tara:strand:+ start:56 stop:355 length:300 start_codon:yes stop_codon:yes gene_type:complete